jgi:molecular chaperone DnaK
MYAAAEADQPEAGGSTVSTGEAADDVVDAEIVDDAPEGGDTTGGDTEGETK